MIRFALRRGTIGFTAGIAADYIAAMIVSFVLKLGYFMPCLASLPEKVGGEMNAVLLQAITCGFAGAAIGIATVFLRMKKMKAVKHRTAIVLAEIVFVFLVDALVIYML